MSKSIWQINLSWGNIKWEWFLEQIDGNVWIILIWKWHDGMGYLMHRIYLLMFYLCNKSNEHQHRNKRTMDHIVHLITDSLQNSDHTKYNLPKHSIAATFCRLNFRKIYNDFNICKIRLKKALIALYFKNWRIINNFVGLPRVKFVLVLRLCSCNE